MLCTGDGFEMEEESKDAVSDSVAAADNTDDDSSEDEADAEPDEVRFLTT